MKKILLISNFDTKKNPLSGIFFYNLLDKLDRKGNFQFEHLVFSKLNTISSILRTIKIARNTKSDFLHAQYGGMTGFVSLFVRVKYKRLITLRGSDFYLDSSSLFSFNFLQSLLTCLLTRISLIFYNKIFVVSHRMRNDFFMNLFKYKVSVITDGCSDKKFQILDRDYCCNYLGLNPKKVYIGVAYADISVKMKRFDFVDRVSKKFVSDHPDVQLIVMKDIKHDELVYFYNCLNYFLLASDYEGMPNVIKESMMSGIPFISTDVSDLKNFECVKNELCFVCKRSESEFLYYMNLLLESDFSRETRNLLRKEAQQLFGLDFCLELIEQEYYQI